MALNTISRHGSLDTVGADGRKVPSSALGYGNESNIGLVEDPYNTDSVSVLMPPILMV